MEKWKNDRLLLAIKVDIEECFIEIDITFYFLKYLGTFLLGYPAVYCIEMTILQSQASEQACKSRFDNNSTSEIVSLQREIRDGKRHYATMIQLTVPYELSRSRIENFVRCPASLQQVKVVPFPSIPISISTKL